MNWRDWRGVQISPMLRPYARWWWWEISSNEQIYGARRWTSITRKLFFYLDAKVSHGRSHLRAVKRP
ncbi:hypothetical protein BGY98DRAFT_961807 [Russula aff. rugulosa BPL654]|nr:hypothetical protein BGY98DRAFT_961807 [Russula aff. rugulosa BPL654]